MKQKGVKWSSYYKTIDALRPLFHKSEFTEVITGFYLNISEDYDAVRILYFVNEKKVKRLYQLSEIISSKIIWSR